MGTPWIVALCPVLGLAGNVVAQVLIYRLVPRLSLLKSLLLSFGLGLAGVLALTVYLVLSRADLIPSMLVNGATYAALGYGYFHFVNLGVTARRIRILREFMESNGALTRDELLARYNGREMLEKRIDRLLKSGQIVLRDERYVIGNPTMLYITRAIILMKLLLLRKRSEFD